MFLIEISKNTCEQKKKKKRREEVCIEGGVIFLKVIKRSYSQVAKLVLAHNSNLKDRTTRREKNPGFQPGLGRILRPRPLLNWPRPTSGPAPPSPVAPPLAPPLSGPGYAQLSRERSPEVFRSEPADWEPTRAELRSALGVSPA